MDPVADAPLAFASFPLLELRQPLALNHFKKAVLGARHRPGEPQVGDVMRAFAKVGMDGCLDPRTWTGWFNDPPRKARRDAVAKLDGYVEQSAGLSASTVLPQHEPRSTFYVDLIDAGLVEKLLRRTNAKPPIKPLLYGAYKYQPTSSSHLHLDALECAALAFEGGEVTCGELKALAAKRVLELIYERWKPGKGSIYKELSSSLKLHWNRSDDQMREEIRRGVARLIPDRFELRMNEAPSPDWMGIGVSEDFAPGDIHKVLFLLAADTKFLVDDRFDAWVIDLVSAGVAAYALAQTDPHASDIWGLSPTSIYWDGIRALFFADEHNIGVEERLERLFSLVGGEFSEDVERNLFAARAKYSDWLESLGLSARRISDLADFQPLYPLIFVGSPSVAHRKRGA
jgi:hypothetical protein